MDKRAQGERILFGAEVEIDHEGQESQVRIVGADEIDPTRKHTCIDSPLARALLKNQVDDVVHTEVDGVRCCDRVIAVRFADGIGLHYILSMKSFMNERMLLLTVFSSGAERLLRLSTTIMSISLNTEPTRLIELMRQWDD